MKVSIITPSFNSEKTIRNTIDSVLDQTHEDIEYIVIDGDSSDRTVDILKEYGDKLKYVSEKDNGIYDAMNKGIKKADGDVIGIINSDDFYANNEVIEKVVNIFKKNNETLCCYGDIDYVHRDDIKKVTRRWIAGQYNIKKMRYGWAVPHPAMFVKKEIYERYGLYLTNLKMASDYEMMIRLFVKNMIEPVYIKKVLANMRQGGTSASNLKARIQGWKEIRKSWELNGLKIPFCIIPLRIISKINQFI